MPPSSTLAHEQAGRPPATVGGAVAVVTLREWSDP
jgi:hypothetical protein